MSKRLTLRLLTMCGASVLAVSAARAEETVVTPQQIKWAPARNLSKGAQVAMLQGNPNQPGPYAYRVKLPPNFKIAPHSHSDSRTYVILSGTLYQGEGEKFDQASLKALPAGTFMSYTAGGKHFAASKQEVIFQVNGIGPSEFTYLDPADDPRKK